MSVSQGSKPHAGTGRECRGVGQPLQGLPSGQPDRDQWDHRRLALLRIRSVRDFQPDSVTNSLRLDESENVMEGPMEPTGPCRWSPGLVGTRINSSEGQTALVSRRGRIPRTRPPSQGAKDRHFPSLPGSAEASRITGRWSPSPQIDGLLPNSCHRSAIHQ